MDNEITRLRIRVRAWLAVGLAVGLIALAIVFTLVLTSENPDGAVIALLTGASLAVGDSLRKVIDAISSNPTDSDPDTTSNGNGQ